MVCFLCSLTYKASETGVWWKVRHRRLSSSVLSVQTTRAGQKWNALTPWRTGEVSSEHGRYAITQNTSRLSDFSLAKP